MYWLYIDDFGAISVDPPGAESTARQEREKLKARLREIGFVVHKEEEGPSVTGVGVVLDGQRFEARPVEASFVKLVAETLAVVGKGKASPHEVERLIGGWTWRMVLCRPCLAVFDKVYAFVRSGRHLDVADLPPEVRWELEAAVRLRGFMRASWRIPLATQVYMTDASPTGGGLVETTGLEEEILEELPFVTQGRWLMRQDWLGRVAAEWAEELSGEEAAAQVERPFATLLLRFCYLCSGPRRPGDMEEALVRLSTTAGVIIVVDLLDLEVAPQVDLLDPKTQEEIRAKARLGWWHGAFGAPPCATWSAALHAPLADGSGPRPCRSRQHPWGLPEIAGRRRQRCLEGSLLLVFTLEVLALVAGGPESRRPVGLEHPADMGRAPFASIWATPEVIDFEAGAGLRRVLLDQCRFGADVRKPTCISTNAAQAEEILAKRCNHSGHPGLIGLDAEGGFRTTPAARYPEPLCAALAEMFLPELLSTAKAADVTPGPELGEIIGQMLRESPERAGRKAPVQAAGAWINDVRRWRETFRTEWRFAEASNVVEARMILLAARHLGRARATSHCRVLLFTDSLAALAVIAHGRSSAPPLLSVCRGLAAVAL